MSVIDMKQFHQVFFEESEEHLEEMEQLLLALDLESPDAEHLNSIFRAAHSIKGGSGIFGFEMLARLTHVLENLLDKIRHQQLAINEARVDIFLRTIDHLKTMLLAYRGDTLPDWEEAKPLVEALEAQMQGQGTLPVVADEGFGFFDEPETAAKNSDDDFGFFDDTYSAAEPAPTSQIVAADKATTDKKTAGDDSAMFGFFDDLLQDEHSQEAGSSPVNSAAHVVVASVNLPQKNTPIGAPLQKTKPVAAALKDNDSAESSSIRVDVNKVDQLINLVGEIVITQSMMSLLGKSLEGGLAEKFQAVAGELERNTREIQEAVMSIRMLPVSFVFNRFPRLVRDLSNKLNKQIALHIEGGETELDKGLTEKLVDPLTHLVRNSIDHGIEPPEQRIAKGKPACGRVILRAAQQGGSIVISISDDGAGLNRERILAKAYENQIPISENPRDDEVWQLIFAPGFSTASEITDVSGRGVGMDVVKRNVQRLGGRIDIESRLGEGACFTIRLPLTLAIVDGMCVSVGDETFIIPLVHIVESMQPKAQDISRVAGEDELLHVRDQYWPMVRLHEMMQLEPKYTKIHEGIVVLVETEKQRFALFVDGLLGQQQVVIKSLEQHYRRVAGIAGATIMGDGSVALILDVESLALSRKQAALAAAC